MSYDLAVFCSSRPELESALRPDAPALLVTGDVAPANGSVALARRVRGRDEHLCVIDGPFEIEDEDAPEEVATVLLVCAWTVQINLPTVLPNAAFKVVERIARRIADSGDGVLFDPQRGEIVWPRNTKRLRELPKRTSSDETRVELEWLVARHLTAEDAHALLAVLRSVTPEAVPNRFGDFEPMQGRLDRDGDQAFAQMWDGTTMAFWNGRFPFDHGYVSLSRGWGSALSPQEREARRPVLGGRKAIDVDAVSFEFRPEVIDDERWLALLTRLFVTVARQLGCFFAGSYVRPDRRGETMISLRGRYWLGLPDDMDLWLAWIGSAYRSFLPRAATGATVTDFGDGVLLQLGKNPQAWNDLESNKLDWPRELLRRGTQLDEPQAAPVIPALTSGN